MRAPIKLCSDIQQPSGQSEPGAMQVVETIPVCLTDPICDAGDAAAAGKGGRPQAAHEA